MQGRQGKTAWAAVMKQSSLDKGLIGDASHLLLKKSKFQRNLLFSQGYFLLLLTSDIIICIDILDSLRASICCKFTALLRGSQN